MGLLLYAYPGYMSYDSVFQLSEARSGYFTDHHPPAMAMLWRLVDGVVAGPLGMLLIQTACFLLGTYWIFERFMAKRPAAVAAVLVLWFPPVASTMAVIWKDSQMAAYLMMGAALLMRERRRTQLAGLAFLSLATAMRHNALAMTFPLVLLLFRWSPGQRWWKRYAISSVAWVLVTLSAQLLNGALTDRSDHLWHQSLALYDMLGTIRYTPEPLSDAELLKDLEGTHPIVTHDLQRTAQQDFGPGANEVDRMWEVTQGFFEPPTTAADRAAVFRAWHTIVLEHVGAYLRYRWMLFRQMVQLTDLPLGTPIYRWFVDVTNPESSVDQMQHDAAASKLQEPLREGMAWVGDTPVFRVWIYLALALILLPMCFGDREALALVGSALTGEAFLFIISPTTDFRYSYWLIVGTVLGAVVLAARRYASR